jgi:hypothetical protein
MLIGRAPQDPARDLVAARDAAEDVEEDRLHLRVARDHLERVDDALASPPPPRSQKFAGGRPRT